MQITSPVYRLSPRLLAVLLALIGIIAAVCVISRLNTRHNLQIFLSPSPIPSQLRVLHSRGTLFSRYYHFTGPPAVIVSVLQSKGLVEVPADPPETSDMTSFSARERSKNPWDWWQPGVMSKPRFFYLHHESQAVQGWGEGWWINGETNEAYAFISG
jgi:hypothetical protein